MTMRTGKDAVRVEITGGLWAWMRRLIRTRAVPYQYERLSDEGERMTSGALRNFRIAAGEVDAPYYGTCFQDSDVGKWIEAVAYLLESRPDARLEARADAVIECVARAQQPDGYLNTYFTVAEPGKRFTNLRECCELYSFGHLAEGAAAYYEATGKRRLLEVMCRYADLLCDVFGPQEGQLHGYDGHPEAEFALMRLYEVTGRQRYLELSGYMLDARGSEPYFFTQEFWARGGAYHNQHNPLPPWEDRAYDIADVRPREQTKAVGHAVKLTYLLEAMARVAAQTNDAELLAAADRIFTNMTQRRMYVTGAVGSTSHQERFTFDYDLPNDRAYAETCAACGVVFSAREMCRAQADARYADVMERALYNGVLSGMSLSGDRWFYANPQEVLPQASREDPDLRKIAPVRQEWFWCACCPPNLVRTVAAVHRDVYLCDGRHIYVNLYVASRAQIETGGRRVRLTQCTDYPWDGAVRMAVDVQGEGVTLHLRKPGWARSWTLDVQGRRCETEPDARGYLTVNCSPGHTDLSLDMPMSAFCVQAHAGVKADIGRVAVQRGPVIYCLEEADNGPRLHALSIDPQKGFEERTDCLPIPGAPMLQALCGWRESASEGDALYTPWRDRREPAAVRFVPYFLWGNRRKGQKAEEMMIWVRTERE